MAKKKQRREPIDELIAAHVWMRAQERKARQGASAKDATRKQARESCEIASKVKGDVSRIFVFKSKDLRAARVLIRAWG
jgi:hypothetical protein